MGHGNDDNFIVFYSELFFFICLLIVGPMFLYGIFKSFLLHKVLKNMYTYDVSNDFVILNWEYENKYNFLMKLL